MQTHFSDSLRDRARRLFDTSQTLAIARYLRDHPEASDEARAWLDEADRSWLQAESADFSATATDYLSSVEWFRQELEEHGDADLMEELRTELAHARLNFQAARSGSFDTAAGSLQDFLTDAGEEPTELDIH